MAKPDVIRFQIEIDRAQMEELERLAEDGGLRTKKELLNNALTLIKWAARQKAAGNQILSINQAGDTARELEMPFLENLAAAAARRREREREEGNLTAGRRSGRR
jgi:hypothetical protein